MASLWTCGAPSLLSELSLSGGAARGVVTEGLRLESFHPETVVEPF